MRPLRKGSWAGIVGRILPLLLLLLSLPARGDLAVSKEEPVKIQADRIEYLRDQGVALARGRVHIQQGSLHLYADSVRYDSEAQDLQATGRVVWQDRGQEIEAESIVYNLRTRQGKARKIKATTPPWISYGEEVEIHPDRTVIRHAVTTTCEYAEGYRHYSMAADRITLHAGDYLVAENVVLYIGKIPVFYFPVFVRTIHDWRTPFSFSTGSTDYLGSYVLLTTHYLLSPVNYGALYGDYFFEQGLGLGIRHEVALNDASVLSLYGYGVPERESGRFRWESRARGLWALSSALHGRVEVAYPGDGFFSRDYAVARREPGLVSTVRDVNLSATYTRSPLFTLGVLVRRQEAADAADPDGERYLQNQENLPQVTFSLFPQSLLGIPGLRYDLRFQGDRVWTRTNGYYVTKANGEAGLSHSLGMLGGTQNLYNRVGWTEQYQDRADQGLDNAGETALLNVENSLRSRWSWFLNTTFTQRVTRKMTDPGPGEPPDGLRVHSLNGALEILPDPTFRARTSLGYDLALEAGSQSERFSYLRQEVSWNPSAHFGTSATADYSIRADALKSLSAVLNAKSERDFWRFRLSGNYVDPGVTTFGTTASGGDSSLQLVGEVSFALFTSYRLTLLEAYDLSQSRFQTRSVSLYRDLHDWEAEINYAEDRFQGSRVFFKLNLKAFPGRPLTVSEDQLQRLNGLQNQGLTGAADQFQ